MADSNAFAALSLRDLLDARDAYHVHLLSQPHVAATAVGRYLARDEEADREVTFAERLRLPPGERPPRTLERSSVRKWSWPCVLVFVDRWMNAAEIRANPDAMVPRRLYLPDGRIVPTCVVYAPPALDGLDEQQHLSFPSELLGGGYVCLSQVQGRERVGSIGCLVSDGDKTYALTNRHVAGTRGRELYTFVNGEPVQLGTTAERSVRRLPFTEVYPGFPGARVEVALDAGLIELADVNAWTTQVFGIGRLSEMMDISPESLTLSIIGTRVRAFGAASGALAGQLLALYYRYRTRSGIEYVADALIGPHGSEPLRTQPGDSGTLWLIDPLPSDPEQPGEKPKRRQPRGASETAAQVPALQPLALQWGGHRLLGSDGASVRPYALASFLSTVCRALDVELVYDWNLGHELYWGEVGHYTIGAKACELVQPAALRSFFLANQRLISFDLQAIQEGEYQTPNGTLFYPLADVPDRVWKKKEHGVIRPYESPNHFADMDDPDEHGDTLLSLYKTDHANLTPKKWEAFYKSKQIAAPHMGFLPFRVAQLYRLTTDALKQGDVTRALCTAGVMAHYVGDACQPLHVSRFHDGRTKSEEGVHSAYETKMIERHREQLIAGLATRLAGAQPLKRIHGHRAAARALADLMQRTFTNIGPEAICETWTTSGHDKEALWAAHGEATIDCIADGCQTLAMLWSSAWKESDAPAPPAQPVDKTALTNLYLDHAFAPSLYLTTLPAADRW